ncbi:copper resistance protein CopC [Actinomadura sp. 7K534]|uniref:copper resistance CopC family protein n=1 Tax=Actinomadura sp. 7K534 TaxID=2530366 RepID=UPI00104D702B|nr:copper resistance protein CopC [Actinomadura sp. 7K534]TDB92412.1 copper resistance protein CopC [Actinomadura sp. 7K534]
MRILKLRRPARGLGIAVLAAALLTVVMAPPALAHPQLMESTPAKGASAESVTEVALVFNEKINVAKVVVTDATGKAFQAGEAERSGTTVTQKLTGALPAGTYTIAYRVVGQDGHPLENDDLTFTAAGGAAPAPSAGGVGAAEQTGPAATADEQPLKIDQEQAAADEESGSGAVLWVLIIVGLLLGVGIGLGIVYRAKRKHQAATGSE